MKKCMKCGTMKDLGGFYRHKAMADGHLNKCKECTKDDVKRNRDSKIEYYRKYDAWRFQNDLRVRKRHEEYRGSEAYRKSITKSHAEYKENNPEKRAAHVLLGNAVRDGRVIKPDTCSVCGNFTSSRRLHGHHDDYSKPLDVVWMCIDCHAGHHFDKDEDFTPITKGDKTNGST